MPLYIANGLKGVFFGGNWTSVNIKDSLKNISWQQANKKVLNLHSIAELVFHIDYFVVAVLNVLKGNSLNANDKYSFDLPVIECEEAWSHFISNILENAQDCALYIEKLEVFKLEENFVEIKYGNYYQNLSGIIEHAHYHLGQIILLKKLIIDA